MLPSLLISLFTLLFGCISLGNITRTCGANPPGIITFKIVRASEVSSIPTAVYNTVSGDIVMATGKKFATWEFSEESGKHTDVAVGEIDGRSIDTTVDIFIPNVDATKDYMFENGINDRYIILTKDGSSNWRIHGEVGRGMRMDKCDYDSGDKPESRRGTTLSFKRNFSHKSYFYTGATDTISL